MDSLPFQRQSIQFLNVVQIDRTALIRRVVGTTKLINVPILGDTDSCVDTWMRSVGLGIVRYCSSLIPFTRRKIQALDHILRAIELLSCRFSHRFFSPKKHLLIDNDSDVSLSRWGTRGRHLSTENAVEKDRTKAILETLPIERTSLQKYLKNTFSRSTRRSFDQTTPTNRCRASPTAKNDRKTRKSDGISLRVRISTFSLPLLYVNEQ